MPVIPATQEADMRRIVVQSQPWAKNYETLSRKRAGGVAQCIGPEFKSPVLKKKKKRKLSVVEYACNQQVEVGESHIQSLTGQN
jgi:hypothetical protein